MKSCPTPLLSLEPGAQIGRECPQDVRMRFALQGTIITAYLE